MNPQGVRPPTALSRRQARADANVTRLMTIPGIDMVVPVGLIAAIGPVARYAGPDRLVVDLLQFSGSSSFRVGQGARSTRRRRRSKPARPYISRLMSFSFVIWPSD